LRKLIVYKSEEDYREQAGAYPNLINFHFFGRHGEVDDGGAGSIHVDFAVANSEADQARLSGNHYDAVEVIGKDDPTAVYFEVK
jgi:hypothetical protein